jgi:hypothetical protein
LGQSFSNPWVRALDILIGCPGGGDGFFNGGALARPRPYLSFANNPVFRDIQKKLAVNEVFPREETP